MGLSDHCLVHFIPTYRQKLKSEKPVLRTVKRWTIEAEQDLKACFDLTDWSVFEAAATDLDELTETVTSYISFCEDMCIPTRTCLTYNNDKPWFTAKLRQLRQAKEDAYRMGDKVLYKQAKYTLEKEISVAKRNYSGKLRNKLSSSDSASVWKGMKDFTNDKTPSPSTVENQQLADDLNVFCCRFEKKNGDESAYRQEVKELAVWCSLNNLELNTLKTVEMIVDFRRNPPALPPLTIMNSTVTAVESFRFLGTTISQDLKWDNHIDSIVRKAQQRLYFLRQLRKFNLPQELLKQFYSAIIESVLCTSITVWFSSATKSDLRRLRRVVRTAERIIGTTLPTLQELYLSRVSKRAGKITLDPSHPAHSLFELLPSGRRYRALSTRMTRHRNSFFPQAIHLMNT